MHVHVSLGMEMDACASACEHGDADGYAPVHVHVSMGMEMGACACACEHGDEYGYICMCM